VTWSDLLQGLRAALNAALFRTGDQSRDFAVVLATNRPADLDPAVLDRMDEALEFPLPGPLERARILDIYLNSYIAKAGSEEGTHSPPSFPALAPHDRVLTSSAKALFFSYGCCCPLGSICWQTAVVSWHMGVGHDALMLLRVRARRMGHWGKC
jgi:hypothetical protein